MPCQRPAIKSLVASLACLFLGLLCVGPLAAAPRPELLITAQQLAARLDDPDLLVLHVGADRESFDGGHIPGAQFLPWDVVATTAEGVPNEFPAVGELAQKLRTLGLSESSSVVLYDAARGLPSARAFVALEHLKLGRTVAILDGQWAGWLAEERPVEKGGPKKRAPGKGTLQAADRSPVVGTEELRRVVAGGQPQLVDARSWAEFSGEKPGRDVSPNRAGHIEGAHHVVWEDHLAPGDVPYLRPAAELHELYGDLDPEKPVVAYCRTGVKASHSYFVLRYLGFEPRLYDASYFVWHRDFEAPIAKADGPKDEN